MYTYMYSYEIHQMALKIVNSTWLARWMDLALRNAKQADLSCHASIVSKL